MRSPQTTHSPMQAMMNVTATVTAVNADDRFSDSGNQRVHLRAQIIRVAERVALLPGHPTQSATYRVYGSQK